MKLLVVEDNRCTMDAVLAALRPLGANVQVLEPPDSTQQSATYADLGLSERQAQVLALLAQGKPTKIICRELGLAQGTVKVHIGRILKVLKVTNRTQAVVKANALGLEILPRPT